MEVCLVCGMELKDNEELHCSKCNEELIKEVNYINGGFKWFE